MRVTRPSKYVAGVPDNDTRILCPTTNAELIADVTVIIFEELTTGRNEVDPAVEYGP
jgi:hypothetical protein